MGSDARCAIQVDVSAWSHRWRRSPTSSALATSRCQIAGTTGRLSGIFLATASAYGSASSAKHQANATDPSSTYSWTFLFGAFFFLPMAHVFATGVRLESAAFFDHLADGELADRSLPLVPVREHLFDDLAHIPLDLLRALREHGNGD